ncbi:tripartite tricarboxylate transporter TctB family protein [Salibacterium aidingense]|uniref:tripartite tricarboxylate transporter TctB family protein n=1 Tax=Salibacterium aidingense TaxID=384933 RepID=UPI003BBCB15F
MNSKEIWSGITFIIIALIGGWGSLRLPETPTSQLSSGFFPLILFIGLGLCGIGLIGKAVLNKEKDRLPSIEWRVVLPVSILIILYPFSIDWIGFLFSSIPFLLLMMLILGERHWKNFIIFSIGAPVCIYLLFTHLFQIMLP